MTAATRIATPALWIGLWGALVALAMVTRPILPMDETRYVSVAWEMWRDGQFLVPHLNGEPYSHKPPLLFWLMNAGWAAFGVNDWWPRLVAPLFGLASLAMTGMLARRLWPGRLDVEAAAPLLLLGGLFWSLFTTLTMSDMLVTACALLGFLGLVRAWRRPGNAGFAVVALSLGLGVLAKGPAIALHVLPVALLAPWWGPRLAVDNGPVEHPPGGWRRWYLGLGAATVLGALIALAWAVPAAIVGGADYGRAIFWDQSAGRMVDSFAHERPWWWFLAVLPGMLLPWTLWPQLWRAAWSGARKAVADGGVRFCLCWLAVALAAFSAISGKQLHYLLPEMPAFALLFAVLLFPVTSSEGGTVWRWDVWPPAALVVVACLGVVALPVLSLFTDLPSWAGNLAPAWALIGLAAGAAVLWRWPVGMLPRVVVLTSLTAVLVAIVHLVAQPTLAKSFDLAPAAARLAAWERDGYALANFGKYHGQFHFLGRLQKPMPAIGLADNDQTDWLARHPRGKIVSYQRTLPADAVPDLVAPFRGRSLVVWDAEVVRAHPTAPYRGGDAD